MRGSRATLGVEALSSGHTVADLKTDSRSKGRILKTCKAEGLAWEHRAFNEDGIHIFQLIKVEVT